MFAMRLRLPTSMFKMVFFFLCGKPHLHEPDDVEIKVQEIVRVIKWTATKQNHPNAPPSSIFRDEISTLNDTEVSMKL